MALWKKVYIKYSSLEDEKQNGHEEDFSNLVLVHF